MPLLDHQFKINNTALPYSWAAVNGVGTPTDSYVLNNKSYEVGLASFFLEILTGPTVIPSSIAITHQFQMDRAGLYFGTAHVVDNDAGTNIITTSSTSTSYTFEANLQNQNWWKFSAHGGRIVLTPPSTSGAITIRELRICGI